MKQRKPISSRKFKRRSTSFLIFLNGEWGPFGLMDLTSKVRGILYSFQHRTIFSVITPCYQGVLYHRKQKFTYFHGGQWKIVHITVDFGHKNSDRNLHISLEGRKRNIFNIMVRDICNHSSQDTPSPFQGFRYSDGCTRLPFHLRVS